MLSSNGGSKQGIAVAKSFLFLVQREKNRKYCLLCSLRSLNVTDQTHLARLPKWCCNHLENWQNAVCKTLVCVTAVAV